jgi:hypothetical protein
MPHNKKPSIGQSAARGIIWLVAQSLFGRSVALIGQLILAAFSAARRLWRIWISNNYIKFVLSFC